MEKIKALYQEKGTLVLGWLLAFTIGFILYRYYDRYLLVIPDVFQAFVYFVVIYAAYSISKTTAEKSKSSAPVLYIKALFVCAFIAAFSAYGMGGHFEDSDPLFSNETKVIDYVPTDLQYFWRLLLILALPAAHGVYKGKKWIKHEKT